MYSRWRKDIWFWQGEQAENVFCVFILTSRFADFICLWLFVLSNSNNLTDHVLLLNKNEYCMKYKIYRVKFPYISCMPTWALISILTYLTSMIPPVYYKYKYTWYFIFMIMINIVRSTITCQSSCPSKVCILYA